MDRGIAHTCPRSVVGGPAIEEAGDVASSARALLRHITVIRVAVATFCHRVFPCFPTHVKHQKGWNSAKARKKKHLVERTSSRTNTLSTRALICGWCILMSERRRTERQRDLPSSILTFVMGNQTALDTRRAGATPPPTITIAILHEERLCKGISRWLRRRLAEAGKEGRCIDTPIGGGAGTTGTLETNGPIN